MLTAIATNVIFFAVVIGAPILTIWIAYEPDPNPRFDSAGRKIHGDCVHLDFYPLRYLPPIALLCAASLFVPSIVTVLAVTGLAGTLLYNLVALRQPDYHLRRRSASTASRDRSVEQ